MFTPAYLAAVVATCVVAGAQYAPAREGANIISPAQQSERVVPPAAVPALSTAALEEALGAGYRLRRPAAAAALLSALGLDTVGRIGGRDSPIYEASPIRLQASLCSACNCCRTGHSTRQTLLRPSLQVAVLGFDSYFHRNAFRNAPPLSSMKRVPGCTIPMVPMLVEQIRALQPMAVWAGQCRRCTAHRTSSVPAASSMRQRVHQRQPDASLAPGPGAGDDAQHTGALRG